MVDFRGKFDVLLAFDGNSILSLTTSFQVVYAQSPYEHCGIRRVGLKHNLDFKGRNSQAHPGFPGKFESSNVSRDPANISMFPSVRIYIYIYICSIICNISNVSQAMLVRIMLVGRLGVRPVWGSSIGGNRLSNTTCLTHAFFKTGESCSKLY